MKRELRDQWCAKLRSGEIAQIRGTYKDTEGCCAIGVLLEVLGEKSEIGNGKVYMYPILKELDWYDGIGLHGKTLEEIVYLNDGKGLSFFEIADKIEEMVPVSD